MISIKAQPVRAMTIHGAWSSSISFNHMATQISADWQHFGYDHRTESLREIIQRARDSLSAPVVLLGHSLGGMVSLALEDHPMVQGIVTLASPLTGLDLNLVQVYLSRSSLIGEITNRSHLVRDLQRHVYSKPVLHLVANQGFNPFIYEQNDGVLPYKVQTGWGCGTFHEIAANHYEILQSADTIAQIRHFMQLVS
jgi:pimeloyl-ACP methyl ester carboxylesterase